MATEVNMPKCIDIYRLTQGAYIIGFLNKFAESSAEFVQKVQ